MRVESVRARKLYRRNRHVHVHLRTGISRYIMENKKSPHSNQHLTSSFKSFASCFAGTNCDDFDHCFANPCENNATCLDFADDSGMTYNCSCTLGFSGVNCSVEDECVTQNVTCLNDGVCVDMEGDFMCENCSSG